MDGHGHYCLSILARIGATYEKALVTQAMVEHLAIVTRDELIADCGVDGIEDCVENDDELGMSSSEAAKLFDLWLNVCPSQGSRTIRTEEALLVSLARLSPAVSSANH